MIISECVIGKYRVNYLVKCFVFHSFVCLVVCIKVIIYAFAYFYNANIIIIYYIIYGPLYKFCGMVCGPDNILFGYRISDSPPHGQLALSRYDHYSLSNSISLEPSSREFYGFLLVIIRVSNLGFSKIWPLS